MKYKIIPLTSVLVLILICILLFNVKIPMCYNTFEEKPKEAFVLYDTEVITQVKEQIKQTPFHYIKIIGNSMFPNIKNGDTCVCIPQETYEKGDIVSFYVPSEDQVELISHRIVEEENNQFTTKGDANNFKDSLMITEEQIFCQIPEKSLFDKFRFAIVESEGRFSIFSIIG